LTKYLVMVDTIRNFLMAFIPLFVAFDCIGIIPIFITFTEGLEDEKRRRVTKRAIITAGAIGVAFIFGGKAIFLFLGVTIADFQIAGGIILLLLAISDLTSEPKQQRTPKIDDIGIVPIGMPLILGPAALTVLMMSLDNFGIIISLLSLTINLIIMNLVLLYSSRIQKVMGKAISSAFSKVMALLLGTIAVMMIRKGILSIIG